MDSANKTAKKLKILMAMGIDGTKKGNRSSLSFIAQVFFQYEPV